MAEQSLPRVGVIGLGAIGRTHIATWRNNGITPVAFADAVPAALEAVVAEFGGEAYNDGVELIRSGTIDIVSICTPPLFHRDLAIAAAEAGVAVLCEKPLARTLKDALDIVDAVESSGTLFTVGFCHRFEPAIEHINGMIGNGDLGTIMTIRNRFAGHMANAEKTWFANEAISGGGSLADTSIHSIDLFRHLAGEPEAVQALVSTQASDLGPRLDVEDTGIITLRTASGTLGVLESSWRTPPGEWTVTIYGTDGEATFDYATGRLQVKRSDGAVEDVELPNESRFDREFAHFIDCWRGDATPRVTVLDGLAANRILDEAYRSAK
ncbi:MAG TPA: Gfo/Idh/MocA family oxidoreductase [Thermomicrobiales bacterium]|nr:Gfo/Idh/MocA family oxidoreductase [Thermomicrobiales bacterium]